MSGDAAAVDLWWLPLGAGGHFVRLNGKVFEAVAARRQRRRPQPLFHSALEVHLEGVTTVIEMGPVPRRGGPPAERGVVAGGPVGWGPLGRFALFRYEVRRWAGGAIPDRDEAVGGPRRMGDDPALARRVLELIPAVPTAVWGRDGLGTGDMWNSNSLIAWALARAGIDAGAVEPPEGGRAPGWRAGVVVAARDATHH
ncbi:MAG: hypothetical protein AB7V62_09120 [Thermoleophilia bacterium]